MNTDPRKISKFVEELVRPHVVHLNLESAYAQMARDKKREEEAMADQLATVSKLRLFKRASFLSEEDMRRIGDAIKIPLDMH